MKADPHSTADLLSANLDFRSAAYTRHNARRQEHLASLGLHLHGQRVLEVGAGVGDHTTFFLDRDCSVVSVEPRPENCALFQRTMLAHQAAGYAKAAEVTLVQCDVESLDERVQGSFDIVYCYGLLYHLQDPQPFLDLVARRCTGMLLLETCVSAGEHEAVNPVAERNIPSQAYHGVGCRPTRPWIFNRLKALFGNVYVPRTQPAHEEFPLDWDAATSPTGLTRAVFIASRQPLQNAILLDHLPKTHVRV